MSGFKRIKRELAYQGTIMKVYKDYIEVNGHQAVWDFFHHNGGAAVIPVTREGKILMVRQYRNAIDRYTLEIPAGAFDSSNESGAECVARELEEETGYQAGKVEWLISTRSMVAFCNEKVEIYVATDLTPSKQHLDEEESIELEEHTIEELKEKIFKGEIEDSKTVASLLAYAVKYQA
jgi:ADP-ribose pyrophosphatase